MSVDNAATAAMDRGTFQKLAVAALIPTLVASEATAGVAKGASSLTLSHSALRTLLKDVVGSTLDSLKAIEVIVKELDRCPPDSPPFFAGSYPHSACRHYQDAIRDLNDFLKDIGNPGYL